MTPSIEAAKGALKGAEQNLRRAVYKQQLRCKHPYVLETKYVSSEYGAGFLPIRICGSCGMTEDGWYFIVLKSNSPTPIERDAFCRMRQGLMLRNEHTGPLLRKETTVKELVTEWYNREKQNG